MLVHTSELNTLQFHFEKYEKEINEFDINNRDGNSNDLPVENYGENNSLEEKSKFEI